MSWLLGLSGATELIKTGYNVYDKVFRSTNFLDYVSGAVDTAKGFNKAMDNIYDGSKKINKIYGIFKPQQSKIIEEKKKPFIKTVNKKNSPKVVILYNNYKKKFKQGLNKIRKKIIIKYNRKNY